MNFQALLIPFGVLIVMSVLGYLTRMLKNASDRRQQEQAQEKQRQRRANAAVASNPSDIDRYIRAVESQRQKAPAMPTAIPVAKAVPTARPRPRIADAAPSAFPEAKPRKPQADELPIATVVNRRADAAPIARPTNLKQVAATSVTVRPSQPQSLVGKQVGALLKDPNSAALAMALLAVLGPPKCRKGREGESV